MYGIGGITRMGWNIIKMKNNKNPYNPLNPIHPSSDKKSEVKTALKEGLGRMGINFIMPGRLRIAPILID